MDDRRAFSALIAELAQRGYLEANEQERPAFGSFLALN